jgi:hypothetical protein
MIKKVNEVVVSINVALIILIGLVLIYKVGG